MSTGIGKRTQKQRVYEYTGQDYPPEWSEITEQVKCRAGYCCERCGHPHDPEAGYTLTTAHMIPDKGLVEEWNLAALCQRCHLHCQHKIDFLQSYMFEHSGWLEWRWRAFVEWYENVYSKSA